ncbi:DNA primase [Buchnera aphidicola (Periphyllus koelreuteriae)]|uniref:DNA primase n=1 Tax=Buchnera aphidicola TaxID=9 RepID=UPI0031B8660B
MTGKIPKIFINELILQTNIVDLIQSKIQLKKKGKNYQTKCPFHEEKTPSFTVSYEKQFYHCFGCHSHGNVIDFLMNYDNLTFIECIEELSILNNIPIPYKNNTIYTQNKYKKRQNLYDLMKNISQIYYKNFINKNSNKAKEYIKNRKINKKILNLFLIGYSNSIAMKKILKTQLKKFKKKDLIDAGIIKINYSGKIYNRFNERIIFPIRDKHGRITGFGGRIIEKKQPKYINSPETEIFHKKKQIYGLYEIKKKRTNLKYIIVVEGYFDVISLTQFKIKNSISILGTAYTKYHIKILFNSTNTIIFCYDGDTAGKNASWETLVNSLPYLYGKREIKFIFLPKNEDPDSIINKEGKKKFKNRIKNSMCMSKFLFKKILEKNDIRTVEGKKNFIYNSISLIKKIPSKTYQFFLYKLLGKKIGILDEYHLKKILFKKKIINYNQQKKYSLMKVLISLVLQNPKLCKLTKNNIKFVNKKKIGIQIFLKIIKKCKKENNINTGLLLEQFRNKKIYNILKYLAQWNNMISKKKYKKTFLEILNYLNIKYLKNKIKKMILKENNIGLNNNEKKKLWKTNKKLINILKKK